MITTCGLADRERCEAEGGLVIDMRSFYDPACGPLKRFDGRHYEIIRRLVHHYLFPELVSNLRQHLEEASEDGHVRFILFCASGESNVCQESEANRVVTVRWLLESFCITSFSVTVIAPGLTNSSFRLALGLVDLHHESLGEGCTEDICSKPSGKQCLALEEGLRVWRGEEVDTWAPRLRKRASASSEE